MLRIIAVVLSSALSLGGCTINSPFLPSDQPVEYVSQQYQQPQPMQPIIINMPGQQGAPPQLVQVTPGASYLQQQPVTQPAGQSTGELVAQPMTNPAAQPVAQSIDQPIVQTVAAQPVQPVIEALTDDQLIDQHKVRALMTVAKKMRETQFKEKTVGMIAKALEIDREIGAVHAKYEDAGKPTAFLYETDQPNAFSDPILSQENIEYLTSGGQQ